jgi:hypothetical protein
MRIFQAMRAKSMRVMLLALFLCVIPASSWAGVFISVGFAPPPLPVMVMADQPPCPTAGWIWTPGYWAYGPGGYYWVPGTWVPAPEPGFYWTPGYWGWSAGLYVWHPGYWGPHVGYYGGVNYGFGYFGIGFVGGVWHGGVFAYNTAVVRVNTTIVHNVYVDRTVIVKNTVAVNSRVAYSGGPGGINHQPTPEERAAVNDHHYAASATQTQHETAAMHNTNNYASHNGGHPSNLATERPVGGNANTNRAVNYNSSKSNSGNAPKTYNSSHSNTGNAPAPRTYNASHSNTSNAPAHPAGGQAAHEPPPQQHESHQPPPRGEEHEHR